VRHGHLSHVWRWWDLLRGEGSPARGVSGLRCVHHIELKRGPAGISARWKQWMTDAVWSQWVLLCPRESMAAFAARRPDPMPMKFNKESAKLGWLDNFENYLETSAICPFPDYAAGLAALRRIVRHTEPAFATGPSIEDIVRKLLAIGTRSIGAAPDPVPLANVVMDDFLAAHYSGTDAVTLDPGALMKISGLTHDATGIPLRCQRLVPGSPVVVRAPQGLTLYGQGLPFLVGVILQQSTAPFAARGEALVSWFVPPSPRCLGNRCSTYLVVGNHSP